MATDKAPPKTFYLNEAHELVRGIAEGGGRAAKYAPINWAQKAAQLRSSIEAARKTVESSKDPLRDRRYFILAKPEPTVTKESSAKNKPPQVKESTRYAGEHSRVFRRLGMDLLHVTEDGRAIVHVLPEDIARLSSSAAQLPHAGKSEQARWATINAFAAIPEDLRVDQEWLRELPARENVEMIIEFQPLLSTVEADEVMRAIAGLLDRSLKEALVGGGTDFSGRHWVRGKAGKKALTALAKQLFSIDAIHPPIPTNVFAGRKAAPNVRGASNVEIDPAAIAQMPIVAVVDCGVPPEHPFLKAYERGRVVDQDSAGVRGDHGSLVASRVVFGDIDYSPKNPSPVGSCRFLDVVVSENDRGVTPKRIVPAMDTVIATYPDVRVFNLSFGDYTALKARGEVDRRELMISLRDLDNFVFARDVIAVIAAGNSARGVAPNLSYPDHVQDENWALGGWAMGFNTLTCGSICGRVRPAGLAIQADLPSPFTRIGPGMADAPIPEYAAPGGDCTSDYQYAPTLGVWGCTADGSWEDRPGTSLAAPILAREAAFALRHLQKVCVQGASPFGVSVKAFLALTARRPKYSSRHEPLARRTIGRGIASAERLSKPDPSSAVFVWQGILENRKDVARVQLPIPNGWRTAASAPRLRLVWAWDPPVNNAVADIWACRHVTALLKPDPEADAIRGAGRGHKSHPLGDRVFDLSTEKLSERGIKPSDTWVVELSYEELAEYAPGIEFSPQQRVAFAAELIDEAEDPVGPQSSLLKLPVTHTMNALGVLRSRVHVPAIVRGR